MRISDWISDGCASDLMTVIVGLAPLLAPTIGSGLLTLFDWTAVFWFLAAFGAAATVCAVVVIPETLKTADRAAISARRVLSGTALLCRSPDYVGGVEVTSGTFLGYASMLAIGAAGTGAAPAVAP